MRLIVVTGKGGVGKTSVALATAAAAARAGHRTLVASTDPAHSLGDSLDRTIGDEPTEVSDRLWAQQIDAQARLEESWREIKDYAVDLLAWAGMTSVRAEEMLMLPGLDELFALADLRSQVMSGRFDVVVVDCAPTAETLRLLSLPEVLSWYIEKIFPINRKVVGAVRPVLQRMRSMPPIASDAVFGAVERFYAKLDGILGILTDPEVTSVRMVVNPEKMVIAEARRTFTYLSLFGYRVDAVIVNRLLPDEIEDPYFSRWKQLQKEHLQEVHESFDPLPVLKVRLFDEEMVGLEMLGALADELYAGHDPVAVLHADETMAVQSDGLSGSLRLRVPFADRQTIDLSRMGDELLVSASGVRRNLTLPATLRPMRVKRAKVEDGWMTVDFEQKAEASR